MPLRRSTATWVSATRRCPHRRSSASRRSLAVRRSGIVRRSVLRRSVTTGCDICSLRQDGDLSRGGLARDCAFNRDYEPADRTWEGSMDAFDPSRSSTNSMPTQGRLPSRRSTSSPQLFPPPYANPWSTPPYSCRAPRLVDPCGSFLGLAVRRRASNPTRPC